MYFKSFEYKIYNQQSKKGNLIFFLKQKKIVEVNKFGVDIQNRKVKSLF